MPEPTSQPSQLTPLRAAKTLAGNRGRCLGHDEASQVFCRSYAGCGRKPGALQQGTHRGVSGEHLQVHLDEYTFRFNRRHTPTAAFQSLLGLQSQRKPTTYRSIIAAGPGAQNPAELTG